VQGVIAMDIASGLASAQLSKLAGEQLNLDYIEVYAEDNWQSATFVVGKYLTDNVFMSYERQFEEESGGEISPEKVTIEYELTRKLGFRLITGTTTERGADVLLRLEKD
jgi:autotransporter translocation and assembly factor TamB